MFFNHPAERPELRMPTAVFARVDQIEESSLGDEAVVFDCIDVKWVDEIGGDAPALCEMTGELGWSADSALSIVVADLDPIRKVAGDVVEDQLYRIDFDSTNTTSWVIDQYTAFFSDPNPRGVIQIEPVPKAMENRLRKLAGWGDFQPSQMSEISDALRFFRQPDAIAIYDVGQGAATAILSGGVPLLYFDFGGSAIGNWRSFPPNLTKFCFTDAPPIVLSHWDWDHWSSALRDPQAFDMAWVLPLQRQSGSLGNVHARFLARLQAHGTRLLWWDPTCKVLSLPNSDARIVQAEGSKSSRNESGLALVIDKSTQTARSVLLPGDASFCHLVARTGPEFDHVMVPHHGGKTDVSLIPKATTQSRSHQIYSYGVGNIFLHPRADVVQAYRLGWKKNTHAALRPASGFGHVGIDLTGSAVSPPSPPCGNRCQLALEQWLS